MIDAAKKASAEAAVALIEDGMALGLGTGSTVAYVLDALAARIAAEGLSVRGVPTSDWTSDRATALGIPLTDLSQDPVLDLAIDGADEVERGTLRLVKGLGGALVREKIVAEASRRFVVVADETKLVMRLGEHAPLPVEAVVFGSASAARRMEAMGLVPTQRQSAGGQAFVSDNGNLVFDCAGLATLDAEATEHGLRAIAGVVGTGLFLRGVERAIVGLPDGTVRTILPGAGGGG